MKMERAMELARKFTGTDSMIKVLMGPVERNKRKIVMARKDMAAVTVETRRAAKAVGTARSVVPASIQAYPAELRLCHIEAAKPPSRVPTKPATTSTPPKKRAGLSAGRG